MFKGLILTVKGFFREKSHAATDLRLAGKEQIHQINYSIQELRDQHNAVAADGILLEQAIAEYRKKLTDLEEAIRHHQSEGNVALVEKAYKSHQETSAKLARDEAALAETIATAKQILEDIETLELDTDDAKRNLRDAATQQVAARAGAKVESVHRDLKGGALAGTIQHVREQNASVQASRELRKRESNDDVFAYKKQGAGKSLDEILGNKTDA